MANHVPGSLLALSFGSLLALSFAQRSLLQPLVARYVDRDRYLNSPQAIAERAEENRKDRLRQRPWVDERDAVLCTCWLSSSIPTARQRDIEMVKRGGGGSGEGGEPQGKKESHADRASLALRSPSCETLARLPRWDFGWRGSGSRGRDSLRRQSLRRQSIQTSPPLFALPTALLPTTSAVPLTSSFRQSLCHAHATPHAISSLTTSRDYACRCMLLRMWLDAWMHAVGSMSFRVSLLPCRFACRYVCAHVYV